ncbi:MAG: ATP-grasp domain-containing protein [Candidatus Zixiibacteriota bacterium]
MGKVLVTDGSQRSTLAVVRSLGQRSIAVTVAEEGLPCLSSRSRYCRQSFRYPAASDNPEGFVACLVDRVSTEQFDLLVPMTDITCRIIGQYRNRFEPHVRIALADEEALTMASDKGEMVSTAQTLGIPAPETVFIDESTDVEALAHNVSFPAVIKPRCSATAGKAGWTKLGVNYVWSTEELIGRIRQWDRSIPYPLIQRRVIGPGCGAFYLCDHGKRVAGFFHRRVREKPPSGGVSVLRESVPVDKRMDDYATRLLAALQWHGVAMVEFKIDEDDDLPKLMEINGRFWGSLQLAIDAGVDFPWLMWQLYTSGKAESAPEYRVGVRSRWLLGDLDHLLLRIFRSRRSLNLPEGAPGRLAALVDFVRSGHADTRLEVFDRDDPAPGRYELAQYVRHLLGVGR